MKQFITQKQWDEIPLKLKEKFKHYPISIGDMIEFLGDDLTFIEYGYSPRDVKVLTDRKHLDNELCDALWRAVKYKLNCG